MPRMPRMPSVRAPPSLFKSLLAVWIVVTAVFIGDLFSLGLGSCALRETTVIDQFIFIAGGLTFVILGVVLVVMLVIRVFKRRFGDKPLRIFEDDQLPEP